MIYYSFKNPLFLELCSGRDPSLITLRWIPTFHFITKLSWTNHQISIDCFHYILVMVREEQTLGLCIHLCFHIPNLHLSFSVLLMWKRVSGDPRESLRQRPLWLVMHTILLVVWWEIRNGIDRSLDWSAGTPWVGPLPLKDGWSVYRQSGVQWVFQIKVTNALCETRDCISPEGCFGGEDRGPPE